MRLRSVALSLAALSLAFSSAASAQESRILRPKIEGKIFVINCDRDLPNGRPTLRFLMRLERALGHTEHVNRRMPPRIMVEAMINSYLESHPKVNRDIIQPAIRRCER